MALWITVLFFGVIAVPLVGCGCNYVLKPIRSTEDLCHKWYDQAIQANAHTSTRYECILLIKKKCPSMINIVTSLKKYFDGTEEIWTTEGTASSSTGELYKDLIFYTNKVKPVCSEGKEIPTDCDYWWSIASEEQFKEKYRKMCVDRMLKHCTGIVKTEEKVCDDDQGCFSGGSKTVTYEYNGERTSLDR